MSSLGFASGSVIQEFGYDDDVDEAVRAQIEEETGQELVDEDYRDIVDGAVAWWRDEDGDVDDLADLFLDMKANLESDVSPCWVLVPGTRSRLRHRRRHEGRRRDGWSHGDDERGSRRRVDGRQADGEGP